MTAQTFAFARNQLHMAVERRRARESRPLPTLDRMAELYIKLRRFLVVDGVTDKTRNLMATERFLQEGIVPRFARPDYGNASPRGFQYGSYFGHAVRWRPEQSVSPGQSTTRPLLFCEFLAAYDYPAGSASVRLTVGAEVHSQDDSERNARAQWYLKSKGLR